MVSNGGRADANFAGGELAADIFSTSREVMEPLRVLLEEHMAGNVRCMKRVASDKTIKEAAWIFAHARAFTAVQGVVHILLLRHTPRRGMRCMMMFPGALDPHWGIIVTLLPRTEMDRDGAVEDMSHELLGFLSGTCREAQLR